MSTGFLGCLPWERRPDCIPVVQKACAWCETPICIAKNNLEAAKTLVLVCVDCMYRLFGEPSEQARGLVNGHSMPLRQALLASAAERDRN